VKSYKFYFLVLIGFLVIPAYSFAEAEDEDKNAFIAVMDMNMMILPGTQAYLEKTIEDAQSKGAKLLIVRLDTPGGMLNTSQEMIQILLNAPMPVAMYVSPSGGTATSAGVFITLAAHVAAMSPGTSIGAAHPVGADGKDIEGDMGDKAEQMTIAMVKSIAEQRGRNVEWAEKSVKESNSLTEKEALNRGVVDLIADDVDDLLKQIKGKEVKVGKDTVILGDYGKLPRRRYAISFKDKSINVLANPNIAALLWLGATTGISLELYNPGTIIPGMVGLICLILALAVSQIIPISQGGLLLLILGTILIGAEFYFASGVLGIGGIVALVLGSLYLIDVSKAPDLAVSLEYILPVAIVLGLFLLIAVRAAVKTYKSKVTTGNEGMVGMYGEAVANISGSGRVFMNGENWNATSKEGLIEKGARVKVVAIKDGMLLEVVEVEEDK